MVETILYDKRERIAFVTLNRPAVKNAVDPGMHDELCRVWRDFRDDDKIAAEAICEPAVIESCPIRGRFPRRPRSPWTRSAACGRCGPRRSRQRAGRDRRGPAEPYLGSAAHGDLLIGSVHDRRGPPAPHVVAAAHADHVSAPGKIGVVVESHIWCLRPTMILQTGRFVIGVGHTDRMRGRGRAEGPW